MESKKELINVLIINTELLIVINMILVTNVLNVNGTKILKWLNYIKELLVIKVMN